MRFIRKRVKGPDKMPAIYMHRFMLAVKTAAQGIGGVRSSHDAQRRGRSPGKPGFRRKAPEMRPNFLNNLSKRNIVD
jgi:hypothetical protein